MELVHKNNIDDKLKKAKGKNKEYIYQIVEKYDQWIKKTNALKNKPDDQAVKEKVDALIEYKTFIDQPKFKKEKDNENGWRSQSKLHSTVLEEFMCHLFKDLKIIQNNVFEIGPTKAYSNLFFAPKNIKIFEKKNGLMVNEKNQDFAIAKKIVIETGNEKKIINIPIVSIENKTYLDKTMLEGSIATASKIKSGNPYCLFFVVCETYEVSKETDPVYSDIDEIYCLRKSTNSKRDASISSDLILELFNKVKNHLETNWSDVERKIESGKIIG